MISHKYKCIFIHIPKCAGTSIEKLLGHYDEYTGPGKQDHSTLRMHYPGVPITKLFNYDNLTHYLSRVKRRVDKSYFKNPKNNYVVTKQEFRDYFKFTVVRNPFARAFSWYKNVISNRYKEDYHKYLNKDDFEKFLERQAGKRHLTSQKDYIVNYNGEIEMDYIVRFEELEDDFEYVAEKLGISDKLPHELRSKSLDHLDYYNLNSIEIIKDVYKDDLKMFKYELK